MTTNAQVEANRLNAQKSTGPRSVEGKAVSRFNALKLGLEARSRVIPGEDPEQLEILTRAYHEHLQPANPLESFLVDSLIAADWNRRRFSRIEAQLYRVLMAKLDPEDAVAAQFPLGAALQADAVHGKALQSVFKQLDSLERSLFRSLNELRRLQLDRMAGEAAPEMAEAEEARTQPAPARPELLPTPAAPAFNPGMAHPAPPSRNSGPAPAREFGFVLPKPWAPADGFHMADSRPATPPKAR